MDIRELRDLVECRSIRKVAAEAGVSPSTLHRMVKNPEANPTRRNLEKVLAWLEQQKAA